MGLVEELLSDKTKWTQHYLAKDSKGEPTDPQGPNAVCWCLGGAIAKLYVKDSHIIIDKINLYLKGINAIYSSLEDLNDYGGYDRTMKIVRELQL